MYRNILLGVLLLIIVGSFVVLKNTSNEVRPVTAAELQTYAQTVLEKCSTNSYRPGCYDKEIPALMDRITLEDAFEVTKLVQQKDTSYPFCHVLGHNISAYETKKDPSKWKDVITRCPSGTCSNGCIHGAFQEKFRTDVLSSEEIEKIIPDLADVCEPRGNWRPTGLEQGSCYHAVGHLIMYITGAEIPKANAVCERISIKPDGRNYLPVCYDGNFMQIFQPLEAEDFDLVKNIPAKTMAEAEKFCSVFSGAKLSSCHQESWPLYREQIMTPHGLEKFCSYSSDAEMQRKCYNALFYVVPVQFNFDQARLTDFCRGMSPKKRSQCFANFASRFIETDYQFADASVGFCKAAEQFGVQDECYKELAFYATFNYHTGSPEARHLCQSFPEAYREQCL